MPRGASSSGASSRSAASPAAALASTIGLRETIVVGAVGGLSTIVPILFSPLRSVGKMSELEPDQSSPIASASSAPA